MGRGRSQDNHRAAMQRCGSAAAQMILVPGSHLIWMFSEMGNDQNTKDSNGGNNTGPKKVNWSLSTIRDNAGLVESYRTMIALASPIRTSSAARRSTPIYARPGAPDAPSPQ